MNALDLSLLPCSTPGCTHDDCKLWVHSRCHPKSPVWAIFNKATKDLRIRMRGLRSAYFDRRSPQPHQVMTLTQAMEIAMTELGKDEKETAARIALATKESPGGAIVQIPPGKEREVIERFKAIEVLRKACPDLQEAINNRATELMEARAKWTKNN
jgi:hypothetical protein